MFVHTKESIYLLINDFHNVIRDCFSLKVLQEFFGLLLFLVLFISKVLLEALIDFFKLFLSLSLVGSEIILLLQFVPYLQLINKICEETIHLIEPSGQVGLLKNILNLVSRNVDQELVSVDILRQSKGGQQHVNEILHMLELEVTL